MVTIIAAVSKNGVIGIHNKLPWPDRSVPKDFPHFVAQTRDTGCVMGRQTYESMNSLGIMPLDKDRISIIVSTTMTSGVHENGIIVFPNLGEAIIYGLDNSVANAVSLLGGTRIWQEALLTTNFVTRALITRVDAEFEGDTYFPEKAFQKKLSLFYRTQWKEKEEGKYSSTLEIWQKDR